MTDDELRGGLAEYRAGLEAQIGLLEQLVQVSARQRGESARRDFEQLGAAGAERDRLTQALVTIENGLKDLRVRLTAHRDRTVVVPGYRDVVTLRQQAAALVARILATDEESIQALADAELARRAAVASLEQGETTLAAYRRVLSPTLAQASLLDRRG
jgi:hypothetical protein